MENQEIKKTINDFEIDGGAYVDDVILYLESENKRLEKRMYPKNQKKELEDLLFKMKVLETVGRYDTEKIKETEKWLDNDKAARQIYDKISLLLNGVKKLKAQGKERVKISELREVIIDTVYIKIFSDLHIE